MRSIALTVIDAADDTHEHHQVDRRVPLKRGLRLEYISLGWNLIEGAVAIVAGVIAASRQQPYPFGRVRFDVPDQKE